MTDLIDRIESANGPSRELDADIARLALGLDVQKTTIGPDHRQQEWCWMDHCPGEATISRPVPRYTASLDAALTLVPDGKEWTLDCLDAARDPRFGRCQARIMLLSYADDPEELGPQAIANSSTPALALCAAALRARGK